MNWAKDKNKVAISVRLTPGIKDKLDKAAPNNRSAYVEEAIRMRLNGRKIAEQMVVDKELEPAREEITSRFASDDASLLDLVTGGEITERVAAQELKWEKARVSASAQRLSKAGKIWYPSAGTMAVV